MECVCLVSAEQLPKGKHFGLWPKHLVAVILSATILDKALIETPTLNSKLELIGFWIERFCISTVLFVSSVRMLVFGWHIPLWLLPPWNGRWWLMVISGPANITDNPDQFFPPAGVEWKVFSQDRRGALIGSHPVTVNICAPRCNLLWRMEPRPNLHLIRLLRRGWHSSW